MEGLVDFLAKGQEVFGPSYTCAKVGIVGIELELYTVSQAIEHRIHHRVHFYEKAAVYSYPANHSPAEGVVVLLIGCQIQRFHVLLSQFYDYLMVRLHFALHSYRYHKRKKDCIVAYKKLGSNGITR